ncbi:alpha/beta hydrolase [Alcanivorax sp. S6407]|uniref:alpha/beta hydrolase n=1 Tax=Alcanivorax sp. S6407 TaxID=2926424 RepID=UPI001FF57273|nr:alpha/beta fold hydrolase [Alcanivorax sp. S6407]MCK0153600.1 alpha/beta hydrolase [Alcanivorax sp. S6407]
MAMVLRLGAVALAALMLTACSKLFFYPMEPWVQNPENQGLKYEDIVLIHPRGLRIHGWWLPAAREVPVRGTVYYLHGNAQNISTHLANVQWLPGRGYNVFLLDYRGYGLSEGKPRLPEVYADVQLGLDWLRTARRTEGPLVVFGQSLGGAMAATVLGEERNAQAADCVVLEAAFASYRGITNDIMKTSWLLWPFRWLVLPGMPQQEQDPEQRIGVIAPTPLLVMHSDEDEVVPYTHGERLYAAAQAPKTFQPLHGRHGQSTRDPAVQQRIVDFLADSGCAAAPEESSEPQPVQEEPVLPPLETSPPPRSPERGYTF